MMLIDRNDPSYSFTLDVVKTWEKQKRMVTSRILPQIRKVLGSRYQYNDSEARDIIKQLHRSRHRVYNIQQNQARAKRDTRCKRGNTKRADVR